MNIKYMGEQAISYLIQKCKETFALISHTHSAEDVGADTKGSASAALALANQYTDEQVSTITTGDVVVKESEHSSSADDATNADNADKATKDNEGNVIIDTYETKLDASSKLAEAKTYTDTQTNTINSTIDTLETQLDTHTASTHVQVQMITWEADD